MSAQPMLPTSTGHAAIDACWNRIGIRGDGSCVELQRHVHCRNCQVYSAAAVELLDNILPADYLQEWTGRIAAEQSVVELDVESVVIFRIDEEWFGLPTALVAEVGAMRDIHSLPHRPDGTVLGLANVRGELLVCVSFAKLLGLDTTDHAASDVSRAARQRLLVLKRGSDRVAFPVDQVHGTHRYHARELKAVPATVARAAATYIKAILSWDGKTVGLLDDELLLYGINHRLG